MPGTTVPCSLSAERVGSIISRLGDPNNGDNQINILLDPGLPNAWQVELRAVGTGSLSSTPGSNR